MENKLQKLEMLLEAKDEKRSTEEAINIVENFTDEETKVEYFEKKRFGPKSVGKWLLVSIRPFS